MSWKKHFQVVPQRKLSAPPQDNSSSGTTAAKFGSWLPELYSGQPNRIERYAQYDQMDLDSEINQALDTISDFATQPDEKEDVPFQIRYLDDATETEVQILETALRQWCHLNKMRQRLWRIFRNTIKYGDQFFIRDPETHVWLWVDPNKVQTIVVNEAQGKKPEQYYISDLDVNLESQVASKMTVPDQVGAFPSAFPKSPNARRALGTSQSGAVTPSPLGYTPGGRPEGQNIPVGAEHIIHLSLSEGLDENWPFGNSILEPVFKTYKQKELLEDAIIIYRVQRAPERRVFYVDVGNMPSHKAMAFVERVKNEIHQRRIPNRTGGGTSILDAAYNPMSIIEDYFFATCLRKSNKINLLDGTTKTLEDLINDYNEGKTNWVYSLNLKTHEMEPGRVSWAGYTRKNAEMVRVHLDNGEHIDCTPDHRFILRDGSECQAQDLTPDTSLMPLYLFNAKTDKIQHSHKYLRYLCNATGKKKWVHTRVCPKKAKGTVIHHVDFNTQNNTPQNLVEMDIDEHRAFHKQCGSYSLSLQWKDPKRRQKLIDGMRRLYDEADDTFKEKLGKRNKKNGASTWQKHEATIRAGLEKGCRRATQKKSLRFDEESVKIAGTIYAEEYTKRLNGRFRNQAELSDLYFARLLSSDSRFMNHIRSINEDKIWLDTFSDRKVKHLARYAGFDSYPEFRSSIKANHKVVRVEWLEEREDTCDITVESESDSHVFALAAGVYVHNSAEGRGSKVETLPGGEGLNEINDLDYFNRKLIRGLRIPISYLPTGSEEGTAPYSDGRVGTAYIQEYRFSKYCQRLQSILDPVFDKEFKLFLKKKGVSIEGNLFQLEFHAPQNFSKYRQIEMDSAHINLFSQLQGVPWISRRMLARRYLGWTEDDELYNERLWREENPKRVKQRIGQETGEAGGGGGLGDVGIMGGGGEPFGDENLEGDIAAGGEDLGMPPAEGGEEVGGAIAPGAGGGAAGGAPPAGGAPGGAPA